MWNGRSKQVRYVIMRRVLHESAATSLAESRSRWPLRFAHELLIRKDHAVLVDVVGICANLPTEDHKKKKKRRDEIVNNPLRPGSPQLTATSSITTGPFESQALSGATRTAFKRASFWVRNSWQLTATTQTARYVIFLRPAWKQLTARSTQRPSVMFSKSQVPAANSATTLTVIGLLLECRVLTALNRGRYRQPSVRHAYSNRRGAASLRALTILRSSKPQGDWSSGPGADPGASTSPLLFAPASVLFWVVLPPLCFHCRRTPLIAPCHRDKWRKINIKNNIFCFDFPWFSSFGECLSFWVINVEAHHAAHCRIANAIIKL